MPKEIQNSKSDCTRVLDQAEREDSNFWNWSSRPTVNDFALHEKSPAQLQRTDLMERTAQFGERILRVLSANGGRIGRKPRRRSPGTVTRSEGTKPYFWRNMEKVNPTDTQIMALSADRTDFELRISFGFRPSDFGF